MTQQPWYRLKDDGQYEYWLHRSDNKWHVYRRKVSSYNYTCTDGVPSGVRWEWPAWQLPTRMPEVPTLLVDGKVVEVLTLDGPVVLA